MAELEGTPKKKVGPTSFATLKMTPQKKEYVSSSECCICLSEFPVANDGAILVRVVTTRCGHRFHDECLLQSKIKGRYNCPMCRNPLTPPPSSVFDSLNAEHISESEENNTTLREAIITSSRRARDAVRLGILRNRARNAIS